MCDHKITISRCANNKSQSHAYLRKGAAAPSTTGRARSSTSCPGRAAIGAPATRAATRATGTAPNAERRGLAPPPARKRQLGFVKRPRINARRSMGGYSVGPSRALRGQGRPPVGRMRSAPRHAEGTAVPATRCCWSTLACRVRGRGQGEGGRKTAAAAAALRTVCRRCRRCRPREERGREREQRAGRERR